uniref:G-protein coupled receptors family 1 profile domain-containing protein n=1 Tax=Myripristis murdjan TaxID=586833 RepID=A0A668AS28_9TELE
SLAVQNKKRASLSYENVTCLLLTVPRCISHVGRGYCCLADFELLFLQVRDNHVVSVYVINLLVSDLIQMCCLIMLLTAPNNLIFISDCLYYVGLMARVSFMVCVTMERYLVITWPLWYHFRRNIKVSLVVCFMVWAFSISITQNWAVDKLLAFLCRCRMTTGQEQGQMSTVDSNTLHTVSSM